jgi:hypothetical protein
VRLDAIVVVGVGCCYLASGPFDGRNRDREFEGLKLKWQFRIDLDTWLLYCGDVLTVRLM